MNSALVAAARSMVWTLCARCPHDFEGHDLPAIERYFVRRWSRALPSEPASTGHLDVARLAQAMQTAVPVYRSGLDYGGGRPIEWKFLHEQERASLIADAAAIAVEYARLAPTAPQDDPKGHGEGEA